MYKPRLIRTILFAAGIVSLNLSIVQADNLKVFLLGGQSNMDGRASASGLPPSLQSPQPDVMFYEGGVLRDLQPGSGTDFGPEITFGRTMADAFPNESFALIKYARGGSSLVSDWAPTSGGDYLNFNNTVTNGLAALAGMGHTTEIAGMLWTQGERDAKLGRTTSQYEADLNAFIGDMRLQYGANLPFMVSQLSLNQTNMTSTQLSNIRTAQSNVATSDPNTYLINTDGMSVKSDNLHFDANGQQALGNAFASQLAPLVPTTTAKFDFGEVSDGFQQADWNQFELPFGGSVAPQTTPADVGTGWSVTLNGPLDSRILSRNRDPLDAATGPAFSLDDVYVDFGTGIEKISVLGLDASETYDIQFIMFDDDSTNGRTQDVFNVTGGANDFLGTSNGPGGGTNLDSDLDFSVFGTNLSPNSGGELNFLLTNSGTGNRSLVNGIVITGAAGSQTSSFDLGRSDDSDAFQQSGWTQFEFPLTATNTQTSAADPTTGWSLELAAPATTTQEAIRGRTRDPLDGTTGGTFSLDEVFVDFVTGVESLEINGLDPTKTYDVQLIMYDDDGTAGRTQTVTNITNGAAQLLGVTDGPGSPASNLTSDLDFSVRGVGLSPDASGKLIFALENSATLDKSLINGLIISETTLVAAAGDFNNDGVVDLADYTAWRNNLGAAESVLPIGSTDGSGVVDVGDYSTWKSNFGASGASSVGSVANLTVPEPNTCVMLTLFTMLVACKYSRGQTLKRDYQHC